MAFAAGTSTTPSLKADVFFQHDSAAGSPASCTTALTGRIQSWLLGPQTQESTGTHRGGVAGWLDEGGLPEFLYPEVAGYYLTWLAFLATASKSNPEVPFHASSAIEWISKQFAHGAVPPTRLYLRDHGQDWRNRALFSFDIAMIARGVAMASCIQSETRTLTEQLGTILRAFRRFIDSDGGIRPFLPIHSADVSPFPERWSLAAGPHQLKIAGALFSLPPEVVPRHLAAAARRLYRRWRDCHDSALTQGNTHPLLYHLEGLLLAAVLKIDEGAWSVAAQEYSKLMAHQAGDGAVPVSLAAPEMPPRSDVLAQALRAGCILQSRGYLAGPQWEEKLATLRRILERYVQPDGSVRFCLAGSGRHRNTWSAIFAHQALSLFEKRSCEQAIPDSWLKLLV
jgi:hypothetical protein